MERETERDENASVHILNNRFLFLCMCTPSTVYILLPFASILSVPLAIINRPLKKKKKKKRIATFHLWTLLMRTGGPVPSAPQEYIYVVPIQPHDKQDKKWRSTHHIFYACSIVGKRKWDMEGKRIKQPTVPFAGLLLSLRWSLVSCHRTEITRLTTPATREYIDGADIL